MKSCYTISKDLTLHIVAPSKGHVRADVFWGRGDEAEKMAGLMKQQGKLFVLLPKGYSIEKNKTH